MAKGYWVAIGKITDQNQIKAYSEAFDSWISGVGGSFLIRDLETIEKEGTTGHLTAVVEFESKEAAISAYNSSEYQDMIAMRTPFSEIALSIVEGIAF